MREIFFAPFFFWFDAWLTRRRLRRITGFIQRKNAQKSRALVLVSVKDKWGYEKEGGVMLGRLPRSELYAHCMRLPSAEKDKQKTGGGLIFTKWRPAIRLVSDKIMTGKRWKGKLFRKARNLLSP